VDADRLREALFQPRVERWSEVEVGGFEPFNDLDLWLATAVTNFCLLKAKKAAIDSGLGASTAVWASRRPTADGRGRRNLRLL